MAVAAIPEGLAAVSTIAAIGLAVSVAGVVATNAQSRKSFRLQQQAAGEQQKANAQQSAQQAQQAAQERRQQIREERVRRAQIMNQAELTGTSGGSGEAGALGGMSTQLGSNMGTNQASILRGQEISGFLQNSANLQTRAQSAQNTGQMWGQFGQLGNQAFANVGGWGAFTRKT